MTTRHITSYSDEKYERLLGGIAEIKRRELSTPAGWDTMTDRELTSVTPDLRLWIIHGEGWHKYSCRFGTWHVEASYLCGYDDGGLFATRIPASITIVSDALAWLKPAAVRKAEERGQHVRRQGDIWFVAMRIRAHDMDAIRWTRHSARPRKGGGLTIVHPQHKPLILSGKHHWRALRAKRLPTGAGGD